MRKSRHSRVRQRFDGGETLELVLTRNQQRSIHRNSYGNGWRDTAALACVLFASLITSVMTFGFQPLWLICLDSVSALSGAILTVMSRQ
jgi:hypothetical protein